MRNELDFDMIWHQIDQTIREGNLAQAIKEYRSFANVDLIQAKETIEKRLEYLESGHRKAPSIETTSPFSQQSSPLFQVTQLINKGQRIEAIKLYRTLTGASLKEAKDATDKIRQGDISAQIHLSPENVCDQSLNGQVNLKTDQSSPLFQVTQLINEGQKIKAIKLYRTLTGASLKEAKNVTDKIQQDNLSTQTHLSPENIYDQMNNRTSSSKNTGLKIAIFLIVVIVLYYFFKT